jgi:protein-S-isoprenylcysteine O-methyltransferase Ste14
MTMNSLVIRTAGTALIGVIALAVLLLVPAGTLFYWQAWVFIVVFTVSTNAIGVYLLLKDPALLHRRLQFGPAAERGAQKIISSLSIVGFLAVMVFCALDYRSGWSHVPPAVSLLGEVLVAVGLFINLLVFRENTFGASNIRVEQGQTVVSTGPYAIMRHPMYAGVVVMAVGVPLALGSWWGLLLIGLLMSVLVWRILDEERVLKTELPGYTEYTQRVRYRLVPRVW